MARALTWPRSVPLATTLAARAVVEQLLARRAWAAALSGLVVSLLVARVERSYTSLGAADRALGGAAVGLVLPLITFIFVAAALGRSRLNHALEPLTRHGADPRASSLGTLGALMTLSALVCTLLGVMTTLAAGQPQGNLLADTVASGWLFGLGGVTYAACFVAASTFGRRGGGRVWFLLLDFVLGSQSGALATVFPRSHLRNVLGSTPPLGLEQGVGVVALLALALLAAFFAVRRAGNARGAY